MLHNFLNPLKQAAAGFSDPRPGTSSSHLRFTDWLCLGISKPSTSSSHLRLLYSSFRAAPGGKQVGADLGLHHPGNPRASAPSGQLQTTSEHHHPAPAQWILHTGRRLVVSGHCQSFVADWPGQIPPIDLPTATKAQLQEEGVLSPHVGHTFNIQLGYFSSH